MIVAERLDLYAVVASTFMIEHDQTRDGARHIHPVWRDCTNHWGDDLLAAHFAAIHRAL